MIGFAMVGTNDVPRARGFYDPLVPLLGASVNTAWSTDGRVWYMIAPDAPMLVVTQPYDGQPATAGNGSMVALVAPSRDAVRAVHAKAVELGGTDEGGPGNRSDDPGDLYRAYLGEVRDTCKKWSQGRLARRCRHRPRRFALPDASTVQLSR